MNLHVQNGDTSISLTKRIHSYIIRTKFTFTITLSYCTSYMQHTYRYIIVLFFSFFFNSYIFCWTFPNELIVEVYEWIWGKNIRKLSRLNNLKWVYKKSFSFLYYYIRVCITYIISSLFVFFLKISHKIHTLLNVY